MSITNCSLLVQIWRALETNVGSALLSISYQINTAQLKAKKFHFLPSVQLQWWLSSVSDSPSRRQDTSLTPSGLSKQLPPDLLQQVSIFPIRSATVVERHSIVLRTQLGYASPTNIVHERFVTNCKVSLQCDIQYLFFPWLPSLLGRGGRRNPRLTRVVHILFLEDFGRIVKLPHNVSLKSITHPWTLRTQKLNDHRP